MVHIWAISQVGDGRWGKNVTSPRGRWEMAIVDGRWGRWEMVHFWPLSQVGDGRWLKFTLSPKQEMGDGRIFSLQKKIVANLIHV